MNRMIFLGVRMDKILITGADGFIGKNLVKKLLANGKHVYGIVPPNSVSRFHEKFDSHDLNVEYIDLNHLMDFINRFPSDIDTMYHLAWLGVGPEYRNDEDLQIKNINISLECMKFASITGIKKVIMPGSTNEYLYYGKPLNKDAIPSPSNAYGATKIALRYLCSDYLARNNIQFVYAIVTGIYAADRKDSNVIFYTIDKLLRHEKPILTKLEQLWDYVYIDDVVEALYMIGEKGRDRAVYAVGHGDNWPLSKYIEIIHRIIDPKLPLGIGEKPYPDDKMPSSCVDLTDLEKDTGFKPKVDFETGIARVIKEIKLEMEQANEQ